MHINRRDTIVLLSAAASALALSGGAHGAEGDTHDVAKLLASATTNAVPDHVLGSDSAPVTVIEYASPTCPHCAAFSNNVLPLFKAQYVDTGKVKLIVRPFLRNVLDAVVFMLADAGGPDNYHNILETYFRTQTTWAVAEKPRDALLVVAKQLGFTDATFDAALTNQALYNGMEAMKTEALETFDLEGTPTFYVNGKQLTGDKTLEQMAAEIDPLIPADFKPTQPAEATTTTPAEPNAMSAEPATPAGETATPVAPAETATPVAPAAEPNAMAAEPVAPATPAP